MKKVNESFLEVKKSKFYGFLFEVETSEEVESIILSIKKEHKKARHVVYAYKIGNVVRKYEDKEPSNTAGKPVLDVIEKRELDNTLIVVVRYFGGVLLGRGPLTRAYSKCASMLLTSK